MQRLSGKDEHGSASPEPRYGLPGLESPDIVIPEWFQPFDFFHHDSDRTHDTYRRKMPHWRYEGASYFLTFRLHDSLPRKVAEELRREELEWQRKVDAERAAMEGKLSATTRKAWENSQRTHFVKLESHLDACHGDCPLRDPAMRSIAEAALLFFENERCHMGAFVIMPNHVHAICYPLQGWSLEDLAGSWKKHSAAKMNRLLGQTGAAWQAESHDRIIRDAEHFRKAVRYILRNPVKARLAPGKFSLWVSADVVAAKP